MCVFVVFTASSWLIQHIASNDEEEQADEPTADADTGAEDAKEAKDDNKPDASKSGDAGAEEQGDVDMAAEPEAKEAPAKSKPKPTVDTTNTATASATASKKRKITSPVTKLNRNASAKATSGSSSTSAKRRRGWTEEKTKLPGSSSISTDMLDDIIQESGAGGADADAGTKPSNDTDAPPTAAADFGDKTTSSLRIDGFERPFRKPQVQELLRGYGTGKTVACRLVVLY